MGPLWDHFSRVTLENGVLICCDPLHGARESIARSARAARTWALLLPSSVLREQEVRFGKYVTSLDMYSIPELLLVLKQE